MFITLEGTEGAGKTTQLPHLVKLLETSGHDCIVTREPGGTPTGKKIRDILLDPANSALTPEALGAATTSIEPVDKLAWAWGAIKSQR